MVWRRIGARALGVPWVLGVLCASLLAGPSIQVVRAGAAGAEQAPAPDDCAATGVALQNGSFEDPHLDGAPGYAMVPPGGVPSWQAGPDPAIEVWYGGYEGVPSADGAQHVELNANSAGRLYQTVATTPGSIVRWSFAHRARSTGAEPGSAIDVMRLLIGAAGTEPVEQAQAADSDAGWTYHSGFYTVPAGQTSTVFAFEAVSSSSGNTSIGNFLDDISFATEPCLSVATAIAGPEGPTSGPVQRGDVLTITTTVDNLGFSAADLVSLDAAVPAQTTYVPGSLRVDGVPATDIAGDDLAESADRALTWRVGTGAGAVDGGTLWAGAGATASSAPGSSATVSFQVTVDAAASGSLHTTSTADGAWTGLGALPTSTSNTVSVPLAAADLRTVKSVAPPYSSPGSLVAGGPLGYDIATSNLGPDEARDVVVIDSLPPQLGAVSAQPDPSVAGAACEVSGSDVVCRYPTLPVGATARTVVAGTIVASAPTASSIANTAQSTALTEDPDPSNNASSAVTGPTGVMADLAVALRFAAQGRADALRPGDQIGLRASVTNNGPSDSRASTLLLTLDPAGRDWTAASSAAAPCLTFGSRIVCSLGALPVGASIVFDITGSVAPAAPAGPRALSAEAVVSCADPDPVAANNTAALNRPVVIAATADLGTSVALATPIVAGSIAAGGTLSYVVSTANAGPSNAVDLVVTSTVGEGAEDPVGVPDPAIAGGSCVTEGRAVICTYPAVKPGTTVRTTVTARARIALSSDAALSFRAESRSATPDPFPGNDAALAVASGPSTSGPWTSRPWTSLPSALATTGADARRAVGAGLLVVLLGCVLVLAAPLRRRRRPDFAHPIS